MDAAIRGGDFTIELGEFLYGLCPTFTLPESLSFLKNQTITTLNLLLKLVKQLYDVSKDSFVDLGSAFIHVINFYIGTKNASSWTEILVGFASLSLSIFKLEGLRKSATHIQHIVQIFLNKLKGYFVTAESAEKEVKSFWSSISISNPRTLFGIVQSCSGIFTSIICLRNFVSKKTKDGDVTNLIVALSDGFFKIGSEVRQHSENITLFLARVYDWILINAEALMTLQFAKIKWELPPDQIFESKYVDMCNVMNSYLEDPLYLETNNLTLEILRDRLIKLRLSGNNELNKNPVPSIRSAITRYLYVLDGHLRLVELRLNPDNTKPQPMSLTLVGSAGCGKSSASTKIGLMMQALSGRVPNESLISNRGGDPKFEENITGSTDVIVYDDYANDQSKTLQTKEVLDIVNTSKEVIPKASVDEKGRHKYSNIGTIFTTNDTNLGVKCFKTASIESILRRLGLVIFLSIQEEFCFPGTENLDLNHPAVSDEVFNTDVYKVSIRIPTGADATGVMYDVIEYERHEGNNEWRDAVLKLQQILSTTWDKNVARHERAKSADNCCKKCSLPQDVCICSIKNKTSQEELVAESFAQKREQLTNLFFNQAPQSMADKAAFVDTSVLNFSSVLATKITAYAVALNLAAYAKLRLQFYYSNRFSILMLFIVFAFLPFGGLLFFALFSGYELFVTRKNKQQVVERHLAIGNYISQYHKTRYSFISITFAAGASALFVMFSSLLTFSDILLKSEDSTPESSTEDPSVSFAPTREKTNSDALGYFLTKPRPAHTAMTMTPKQVIAEIGKGITQVIISSDDGPTTCVKCLPMGSERLIPRHALPKEGTMDIVVRASNAQGADYKNMRVPQTHVSNLVKRGFISSKTMDASLVHLPNAPPGKDFSKYLAKAGTLPDSAGCIYLHKNCETGKHEEVLVRARLMPKPITYTTQHGVETQHVYECKSQSHTSSDGDCGQPLIYNNAIIGIHIAGSSSNTWYCMAVDASILSRANEVLKQESSIFVASHPADPVLKRNLKNLSISDEPTDYVTASLAVATTPIVSIGTLLDASGCLYKPRAEDHYFRNGNHQVDEEFGKMASRPPKFVNGVVQINSTLAKLNTPKMDAPIDLMDRAVHDYLYGAAPSGETLASSASEMEKAKPGFFSVKTIQDALDGDNTGIIRGMKNTTSSGISYGGKKTNHMERDSLGDVLVPRVLKDYVTEDVNELETQWRSGNGTFDPFVRASKTNEVLPLEKAYEKTRSVYGNDMAFFIAGTRAIMPLKHLLRQQELSECFVGVAAQSSDWTSLQDHLTRSGTFSHFVCGDFSGYDTQLPKSLMEKAAACIIKIYRDNGASNSDIEYLRGFLSSVVSPSLVWEGNLFQLCNGQPSGQPLTVEMNSILNSILIRMAFCTIMDRDYSHIKNPNFRDYVALGVYGDDNAMGVSSEIPLFNHTTIQAVFASWGIKYTMADKGADSVPYQALNEVSFLKRSFHFHPELGSIVAPIEQESLSKKFYWWTKSKNTPLTFPEQFQANFESQAREAYLHGVEFYEEFCAKCERIVEASQDGDERFVLPWNTIQPVSAKKMNSMLIDAYIVEKQ